MNLRALLLPLALLASLTLAPRDLQACACCSYEGSYYSGVEKISEYARSQIVMLRFKPTANLFVTEGELEDAGMGLVDPAERYALTGSFIGRAWRLTFRDGARTGTLALSLPSKMRSHNVDIHDGKTSMGGGPLLYKEWRLEGSASPTGLFRPAKSSPSKLNYVLVLQGRGNGCDDALDFTHWRLELTGKKVGYAFVGELDTPTPE